MSTDNKDQLTDQLLRGIYRMCVNKDDCTDCPFYINKCMFEEPKPRTWFDEETIEVKAQPVHVAAVPKKIEEPVVAKMPEFAKKPVDPETARKLEFKKPAEPEAAKKPEEPAAPQKADENSDGTWLMSTTMGSVFTKYVFICSKCGYKKESLFSITPMTFCPECEKRKAGQS